MALKSSDQNRPNCSGEPSRRSGTASINRINSRRPRYRSSHTGSRIRSTLPSITSARRDLLAAYVAANVAGIHKHGSPQAERHSFATRPLRMVPMSASSRYCLDVPSCHQRSVRRSLPGHPSGCRGLDRLMALMEGRTPDARSGGSSTGLERNNNDAVPLVWTGIELLDGDLFCHSICRRTEAGNGREPSSDLVVALEF